jgi:hypothetical protein
VENEKFCSKHQTGDAEITIRLKLKMQLLFVALSGDTVSLYPGLAQFDAIKILVGLVYANL